MSDAIRLQVVGLPLATYRRMRPELESWAASLSDDAQLSFTPSGDERRPSISNAVINDIRAKVQGGYTHIATVPSRDAKGVEMFRFDCRLIRLDLPSDFSTWTTEHLQESILTAIEFEKQWCARVRPKDWHAPLLLPLARFVPHRSIVSFWKTCDCYNAMCLDTATTALERVRHHHRRSLQGQRTYWVDQSGLRFSLDSERHGQTAPERRGERRFRFCYEVPPGLHFDVAREDGNIFQIPDSRGVMRTVHRANVDPWGRTRLPQ